MSWVLMRSADGSGDMLVCEREHAVSAISLEGVVDAWSEDSPERQELDSPWRLRVWRRRPGDRRGPAIEREEPSLLCVISTVEVRERVGREHDAWIRHHTETILRRLRRYQEGTVQRPPEEGLARRAAAAEGALRRDAQEFSPQLRRTAAAPWARASLPNDVGAFLRLASLQPARSRVAPHDSPRKAGRRGVGHWLGGLVRALGNERGTPIRTHMLVALTVLPLATLTAYSLGFIHGRASRAEQVGSAPRPAMPLRAKGAVRASRAKRRPALRRPHPPRRSPLVQLPKRSASLSQAIVDSEPGQTSTNGAPSASGSEGSSNSRSPRSPGAAVNQAGGVRPVGSSQNGGGARPAANEETTIADVGSSGGVAAVDAEAR
jgi:hypothetical protein